jgi:hypothetical protein
MPLDRDRKVQIMDAVYVDSAAYVGLLTTPFEKQDEVDSLASLMGRYVFIKPGVTDSPKLSPMLKP